MHEVVRYERALLALLQDVSISRHFRDIPAVVSTLRKEA